MKLAALLLTLLLAACGGGSDDEELLPCPHPGERFERGLGLCPDPIGPPDCKNRPEVCQ